MTMEIKITDEHLKALTGLTITFLVLLAVMYWCFLEGQKRPMYYEDHIIYSPDNSTIVRTFNPPMPFMNTTVDWVIVHIAENKSR